MESDKYQVIPGKLMINSERECPIRMLFFFCRNDVTRKLICGIASLTTSVKPAIKYRAMSVNVRKSNAIIYLVSR